MTETGKNNKKNNKMTINDVVGFIFNNKEKSSFTLFCILQNEKKEIRKFIYCACLNACIFWLFYVYRVYVRLNVCHQRNEK